MGYGIILSACVVKVPQISAIARAGSARGLSCLAFELEQLGLLVNAANGFVRGLPFSAYGEALVLLAQNTVLLGQIYALSGARGARPALVASLFLGGGAAVLAGACAGQALRGWKVLVDALVRASCGHGALCGLHASTCQPEPGSLVGLEQSRQAPMRGWRLCWGLSTAVLQAD